jgi:hypothetical protein
MTIEELQAEIARDMKEWVFVLGIWMALIGFPTGWIDWAMNKPYCYWTPWGYGMGIVGMIMCWWAAP